MPPLKNLLLVIAICMTALVGGTWGAVSATIDDGDYTVPNSGRSCDTEAVRLGS
jgi:hypothetical protein